MWWLLNKLHPLMKTIRYGWKPVKILFLRSRNSRSRSLSLKHRNVFWHLTAISCQSVDCVSPHLHASVWPSLCWWDMRCKKTCSENIAPLPDLWSETPQGIFNGIRPHVRYAGEKSLAMFLFFTGKIEHATLYMLLHFLFHQVASGLLYYRTLWDCLIFHWSWVELVEHMEVTWHVSLICKLTHIQFTHTYMHTRVVPVGC